MFQSINSFGFDYFVDLILDKELLNLVCIHILIQQYPQILIAISSFKYWKQIMRFKEILVGGYSKSKIFYVLK